MNTMVQVRVKCFMTITQLNEYNGASDSSVFYDSITQLNEYNGASDS